ncbi:relaxase/mobilization nuclease domain-containing protein [Burkholderia sp. M6-3]
MKANITRGGGFRGALNYTFDVRSEATQKKNAELVGGNMVGDNPAALSREFGVVRKLRPDIKKPVWHCSLALPKDESLSTEKWDEIARDFMECMGFQVDTTLYVVVRHNDTEHDHIHIIASRIALDGSVWLGQWEARRAIEATQELEKKHGLTVTPGLGDARVERKKLTRNETKSAARTGQEPPRERLQRLIDDAAKGRPSALEFARRLEAVEVNARINLASTGRLNGFSFEISGIHFKGQDLGEAYKWNGLQKRGVTYDKERDSGGLERFRAAVAVQQVHGSDDLRGLAQDPRRDLWRAYQVWNRERSRQLTARSAEQRERAKARKAVIKDSFDATSARLNAQRSTGNGAQIRAQLSIARMTRVTQETALREQNELERAELKAAKNKPYVERYRVFLAERVQVGDELALAELRRVQRRAKSLADVSNEAIMRPARSQPQTERDPLHPGIALAYVVAANGDVTYTKDGHTVIVDRAHEVKILRHDDATLETAMRLAIARGWGAALDMSGTDAEKRRVAELAAERHIRVEFADPKLNEITAERRSQMARTKTQQYKDFGEKLVPVATPVVPYREPDNAPEPVQRTPRPRIK